MSDIASIADKARAIIIAGTAVQTRECATGS